MKRFRSNLIAGKSVIPDDFLKRVQDILIPCAAAQMPGYELAKLLPRVLSSAVYKFHSGQNQTRRAEAALDGRFVDEGLLNFVELSRRTLESFDGQDVLAFCPHGQIEAGIHGCPINQDRTGPALTDPAASLDGGQVQPVSQGVEKAFSRVNGEFFLFSVDGHMDDLKHDAHRLSRSQCLYRHRRSGPLLLCPVSWSLSSSVSLRVQPVENLPLRGFLFRCL